MLQSQSSILAGHLPLLGAAAAIGLFGSWSGMRHLARACATKGNQRLGWLLVASTGTGTALWGAILMSILALDASLSGGFDLMPPALALPSLILCCLLGFVIGSLPRPRFAPELGGLVIGSGVVMACFIALGSWHFPGATYFNPIGLGITVMLGFGLAALALNRAYRPVTRWCRHGAAIVFAIMICAIHGTLSSSLTLAIDPSDMLAAGWHPASHLGVGLVAIVLLVTGAAASAAAP